MSSSRQDGSVSREVRFPNVAAPYRDSLGKEIPR